MRALLFFVTMFGGSAAILADQPAIKILTENKNVFFTDAPALNFAGGMVLERSGAKGNRVTFTDRTGKAIASVDLTDGTVTIHKVGKDPEAAKVFWRSIAAAREFYQTTECDK